MAVSLADLWLPILLSAVGIFFTSFLMCMVLPHHKKDFAKVPDEDALMELLRGQGITPGQYVYPCADSMEQMKDPEWQKKVADGPSGMMIIRPAGGFNMGKSMGQSMAFNLIMAFFVAYVATFTLNGMTAGKVVFRLTSIVAFLGYGGAIAWTAIWWNRTWSTVFKEILDAVVYGCVTGAVFVWLWPSTM
jgi:hypothetical protein